MQTVPLCILSILTIIIPLKAQAFELEEQYYGDVADIKSPVQYQENPFTALFGIGKAKMELS